MWLIFFQTPYDTVRYRTSETDKTFNQPYHKFRDYLFSNFQIIDRKGIIQALDTFQTVLLIETGEWRIITEEQLKRVNDVKDLMKLNLNAEEKKSDAEILQSTYAEILKNAWRSSKKVFGVFDRNRSNINGNSSNFGRPVHRERTKFGRKTKADNTRKTRVVFTNK